MTTWRHAALVPATVAVAVAGAFLVSNLHTTASAWRRVDPSASAGPTLILPAKRPAQDQSGASGWIWPDGTPGWQPGLRMNGFLVAGLNPSDVQQTRSHAPAGIDSTALRVFDATRPTRSALLAILAAPTADDPNVACVGVMLHRNAAARWLCPHAVARSERLADAPILVAASSDRWPQTKKGTHPLHLVGVARGDVRRVVLDVPGSAPNTLYRRGRTWGQFDASAMTPDGQAQLRVYGPSGVMETVRLAVRPGQGRMFK